MKGSGQEEVPVHAHRSGTSRVNQIATVEDVSKQEQLHSASTALLNLLKSPACLLDSIGNIVHMNQSWRERAHFASPKSKSMSWVQSIWPEDRHIAISHIRSITATRRKTDFTCRLWNDAETARWYLLSLQPATDIAADEHQWLCIATDIQALKSREAELEHRLSIQTDMLDISVDCIKLIAIDGTVGHMNKAGCRALGIPDKSSFGMPWLPLLPSDVWAVGEEALNEARAGKFSRFPGRSVLPGEAPQYWDNMLTPVMGPNGRPSMVLCVSREVTTERLAQEALRQSEERLKTAAKIGGLGIWEYDIEKDKIYCDEACNQVLGRDPHQPVEFIKELQPFIHADDLDWLTHAIGTTAEFVAENSNRAMVFRIIRPDGDVRWVRTGASVFRDNADMPSRVIGFVIDITDTQRGELVRREERLAVKSRNAPLAHDVVAHAPIEQVKISERSSSSTTLPYHLRKAEEYLEGNWHRIVPIEELAVVADVGVRTLFRSFNQFRGCSPMQFARLVRLHRAREILSNPDSETTVIGTALACGYSNASHFARHYVQAFGERPSQTLTSR